LRSLRVKDGDIALDSSHRASFVVGDRKLLQDLALWLMEPLGVGLTTPDFGSQLWDLIGSVNPSARAAEVEAEVSRILSLYQATQFARIKSARDNGTLYLFAPSEILNKIESVVATPVDDRVDVSVKIQTASGGQMTIPLTVSPEGVSVNA
jgi:hypothetical protein